MRLLNLVGVALTLCGMANAANPQMEQVSGYGVACYENTVHVLHGQNLVRQGGPVVLCQPIPVGQFFPLNATEKVKLTNTLQPATYMGTWLRNTGTILCFWDYVGSDGVSKPEIGILWKHSARGTTVGSPSGICAYGNSAVAGGICRGFKFGTSQFPTVVSGSVMMTGTYVERGTSNFQSNRAGYKSFTFGDNWGRARWWPSRVNPDGSRGAWRVDFGIRPSSGVGWVGSDDETQWFPGTSFSKTFSVNFIVATGATLNMGCLVGGVQEPRADNFWKVQQYFGPSICSGGLTGIDAQVDDDWQGDVTITPLLDCPES